MSVTILRTSNDYWLRTYIKELSCVLISVIDTDCTSMDANIKTNTEVLRHEWAHTITFKDHLALKECTLRNTRVHLLGLNNHN